MHNFRNLSVHFVVQQFFLSKSSFIYWKLDFYLFHRKVQLGFPCLYINTKYMCEYTSTMFTSSLFFSFTFLTLSTFTNGVCSLMDLSFMAFVSFVRLILKKCKQFVKPEDNLIQLWYRRSITNPLIIHFVSEWYHFGCIQLKCSTIQIEKQIDCFW